MNNTQQIKVWRCNNCGHWEPQTETLAELAFKWVGPLTSRTSCPNCGSYTLNKAYDETFYRGEFLVVKSKIKFRGNLRNGRT